MDNRNYGVSKGSVAASRSMALAAALCVLMLAGCATLKEGAKGFLGISTKVLDQHRSSAVIGEFDFDQQAAYAKILEALGSMSCKVYHRQAPSMVALYVSGQDTTCVGIYSTPVSATRTRLEVSSASTYAKEYIAKRLFARLEGREDPFKVQKAIEKNRPNALPRERVETPKPKVT